MLKRARRNIYWQAGLALVTIVLTIVIIFAMTAAWYTNIVQTSGLTFEVAAWGFDGEITVDDTAIQAAPGDSGIVHLEVDNDTENIAAISVNVNKSKMASQMQQRLYFYVDTQQQRNGETVERVYLNNQESYTYTVFANSSLTLTELMHNDARIKWEWVYDVLGYYVLAAPKEDGGELDVYEYLRPVEYDYDEATVTLVTDTNGELQMEISTIDGTRTPEEFLVALSASDGYAGTIDPTKKQYGYYPVVIDDAGYGVWAYLCSYSEIEENTKIDTALGQKAASIEKRLAAGETVADEELEALTFTAQLNVSAQQNQVEPHTVSTLSALTTALESGVVDVIQLATDITIPADSALVFDEGDRVMIDLNGHTLVNEGSIAVDAKAGSSVTLVNGTVQGAGAGYGVLSTGAEVTLSNVNMTDVKYGVYLLDGTGTNELDSKARIVGSTINCTGNAVLVVGNGTVSAQTTQVVIENSTLVSANDIAISGNGTATGTGKWGTDIQLINSTVTGYWAGVYHPQMEGTLTIYNCDITGYTGIAIKGGTVVIDGEKVKDGENAETGGTVITGTGEKQTPGTANSGFTDTGDAIYIETNYEYPVELTISGDTTLTAVYGFSLQVYDPNADWVSVTVAYTVAVPNGTILPVSAQEETQTEGE